MANNFGKTKTGSRELREALASCEKFCSGLGETRIRKPNLRPLDKGIDYPPNSNNKRPKRYDMKKGNVKAKNECLGTSPDMVDLSDDDSEMTTNIKKFLDRGLLNGVVVTCYRQNPKIRDPSDVGTRGRIEGSQIACLCESCHGRKWSTMQFEAHAGCKKKHPAENFYLNRTITVKDVMNACKVVPSKSWAIEVRIILDSITNDNPSELTSPRPLIDNTERRIDYNNSEFSHQTTLSCVQCEQKCLDGTLKKYKSMFHKFCSEECEKIHSALQQLVESEEKQLPQYLLNLIKRKSDGKTFTPYNLDVKWRLLQGKVSNAKTEELLSNVITLFHEQFRRIPYQNERDLVPLMVLGRKCNDRDFHGMHCAILEVNSMVVCAATIRIFGDEVAELPLVATKTKLQKQGYFRVLLSCIEDELSKLNVKWLILPAAHDTISIWTKKFGFHEVTKEELMNYENNYPVMMLEQTTMLHKHIFH